MKYDTSLSVSPLIDNSVSIFLWLSSSRILYAQRKKKALRVEKPGKGQLVNVGVVYGTNNAKLLRAEMNNLIEAYGCQQIWKQSGTPQQWSGHCAPSEVLGQSSCSGGQGAKPPEADNILLTQP